MDIRVKLISQEKIYIDIQYFVASVSFPRKIITYE